MCELTLWINRGVRAEWSNKIDAFEPLFSLLISRIWLEPNSQGVGTNIIIGNIGKIYEKHA